MFRHGFALLVFVGVTQPLPAQTPWQFKWQKGQDLTYRVLHDTAVAEIVQGTTTVSESKLAIVKRWRILDVDAQGTATMELSIVAMRNEQKRPGGEVLLFDSADLDKSTPELRGMAKFLGTTIASLRVDPQGRVVEVKAGPKGKYDAEPPFLVIFPKTDAVIGQSWERPFTITLEPPLGAGEKHAAEQKVACSRIEAGKATLAVTTTIKQMPESPQEQAPLLQKLLQGQAVFDLATGRLESVQMTVDRTVENHQGKGSSYRFVTRYVEQWQPPGGLLPR
jgi:hypothetical protein